MITITREPYGQTLQGEEVACFHMGNSNGMTVDVLEYGSTVRSICVPSGNGRTMDVVLGYDRLSDYEKGTCVFGAVVGRYANRIRNGEVTLSGKRYQMEKNNGSHHLHGCFSHRVFSGTVRDDAVELTYRSPDGEDGLPGTLTVTVKYRLDEENGLHIEYSAETDHETVLNLTNHSYFNLNGFGIVLGHRLRIDSDFYTEADPELLPTGRILPVEGTLMDFRQEKLIGKGLMNPDNVLRMAGGYDHNYIVNGPTHELRFAARARGEVSGIAMECWTTQPGVQFYTGNYIHEDAARFGKKGARYPQHGGFCLETQHYPDSPHFPDFPSTVLSPGDRFHEETVYRFFPGR